MKTTEYEEEECYKCKEQTLTKLNKIPKGRQKYTNQTYLICQSCNTIQLKLNKKR